MFDRTELYHLWKKGSPQELLALETHLLSRYPYLDSEALGAYELGVLYFLWLKHQKFEAILNYGPGDIHRLPQAEMRYILGKAYLHFGQYQKAHSFLMAFFEPQASHFAAPLNIKPSDVLWGLAQCAVQLNHPVLAFAYLRQVKLLSPFSEQQATLEAQLNGFFGMSEYTWFEWLESRIERALSEKDFREVILGAYATLTHHFSVLRVQDLFLSLSMVGHGRLAQKLLPFFQLVYPDGDLSPFVFEHSRETLQERDLPGGWHWRYLFTPREGIRTSLCMICKNEAETLPHAIRSVARAVDEIIVVDTGSTDETLSWLTSQSSHPTLKVFQVPWEGDFAQARNTSISHASGDWILVLDADEVVMPSCLPRLKQFLTYAPLGWQLFHFHRVNQLEGLKCSTDWVPRLFARHPDIQFWGAAHNYVARLDTSDLLHHTRISVEIQHTGYLRHALKKHDKAQRYQNLMQYVSFKGVIHPYYAFHLGWQLYYQDACPDLDRARHYFELSLKETQTWTSAPPVLGWIPGPTELNILCIWRILFEQKNHHEMRQRYADYYPRCEQGEFYYLWAQVLYSEQEWERCFETLEKCFQSRESYYPDGFTTWRPLLLKYALQKKTQKCKAAISTYYQLLVFFPEGDIPEQVDNLQADLGGLIEQL